MAHRLTGVHQFEDRRYGKDNVRLLHVSRDAGRHTIRELEVATRLTLCDDRDFLTGDNTDVIATDTQKNTVYILAKQHGIKTIEEFGLLLIDHFLKKYKQVEVARVIIKQPRWARLRVGFEEHNHAFSAQGDVIRFCEVEQTRNGEPPVIRGGITDLRVMKTTQSAFVGFVKDEYCTLKDSVDRIWWTSVSAWWQYQPQADVDYDKAWEDTKDAILRAFSGPHDTGTLSVCVQKTLYDMQTRVLASVPQVMKIHIELPNIHAFPVEFPKFPDFTIQYNNEVFQPSDTPSGNISATLCRHQAKM